MPKIKKENRRTVFYERETKIGYFQQQEIKSYLYASKAKSVVDSNENYQFFQQQILENVAKLIKRKLLSIFARLKIKCMLRRMKKQEILINLLSKIQKKLLVVKMKFFKKFLKYNRKIIIYNQILKKLKGCKQTFIEEAKYCQKKKKIINNQVFEVLDFPQLSIHQYLQFIKERKVFHRLQYLELFCLTLTNSIERQLMKDKVRVFIALKILVKHIIYKEIISKNQTIIQKINQIKNKYIFKKLVNASLIHIKKGCVRLELTQKSKIKTLLHQSFNNIKLQFLQRNKIIDTIFHNLQRNIIQKKQLVNAFKLIYNFFTEKKRPIIRDMRILKGNQIMNNVLNFGLKYFYQIKRKSIKINLFKNGLIKLEQFINKKLIKNYIKMINCLHKKDMKQNQIKRQTIKIHSSYTHSNSKDNNNYKHIRRKSKLFRKKSKQKDQQYFMTNQNSRLKIQKEHFLDETQSKTPKFVKGVLIKKDNTIAENTKLFDNLIINIQNQQQFFIDYQVKEQDEKNSRIVKMSINKERYNNMNPNQRKQQYIYRIKKGTKYFNIVLKKTMNRRYKEFIIKFSNKQKIYSRFNNIISKRQTMLLKTALKLMKTITSSYRSIIHKIYESSNKKQKLNQRQIQSNLQFLIESHDPLIFNEQILFGEQKNSFSLYYEILSIHLKKPKKTK